MKEFIIQDSGEYISNTDDPCDDCTHWIGIIK